MKENKLWGAHLQMMRIRKNIKQATLAKQLGISQSKLSKIENGRIMASASILAAYYKIFESQILEVLEGLIKS